MNDIETITLNDVMPNFSVGEYPNAVSYEFLSAEDVSDLLHTQQEFTAERVENAPLEFDLHKLRHRDGRTFLLVMAGGDRAILTPSRNGKKPN